MLSFSGSATWMPDSSESPNTRHVVPRLSGNVRLIESPAYMACHNFSLAQLCCRLNRELKPSVRWWIPLARIGALGILQKLTKDVVLFIADLCNQFFQERQTNRIAMFLVSLERGQFYHVGCVFTGRRGV